MKIRLAIAGLAVISVLGYFVQSIAMPPEVQLPTNQAEPVNTVTIPQGPPIAGTAGGAGGTQTGIGGAGGGGGASGSVGLGYGATCSVNWQCQSGICSVGKCSILYGGMTCQNNANCDSGNCLGGMCLSKCKLNSECLSNNCYLGSCLIACTTDSDCPSKGSFCLAGICRQNININKGYSNGMACLQNSDCARNFCISGYCNANRGIGQSCTANSDCESGNCYHDIAIPGTNGTYSCQPKGFTGFKNTPFNPE